MATQQVVNVGTQANDATGDLLRDAFTKINNNFAVFFAGNFPTAQMTIGPPVSGVALTVQAFPGSNAANFIGGSGSFGAVSIRDGQAGTTLWSLSVGISAAGDFNLVNNTSGTTPIKVTAAGAITLTGAVNAATSLAVAGVPVLTSAVTTLTSNTGLSTNVAATGAVTVTNTGVISLAGTANQVAVSASTGSVTVSLPVNVVIPTPGSGIALSATGTAGQFTASFIGSSSASNSVGVKIFAGTNSADAAIQIKNQAGSATFQQINGDGSGTLGPSATTGLSWTAAGGVTVANPSSGSALTVTGSSAGISAMVFNTMATTGAQSVVLNITNKPGASAQTQPAKWLPVTLDGTTYYLPAFS